MPSATDLNLLLILMLSIVVMGISICRMAQIDMKLVRYRYVLPIFLAASLAAFSFWSISGGDNPDYYMSIALGGFLCFLLNNRKDWKNGMPLYMLRGKAIVENERWKGNIVQRLKFENWVVIACGGVLVLGAGAAAMEGRGDPIILFSAHAEPKVTTSNGTVDIVYSIKRVRVCSGAADRFIVRAGTDEVVQTFMTTPIGGGVINKKDDNVRVKLTLANLPPGNYAYRANLTNYCPDSAAPYIRRIPDVPFIVAPDPIPGSSLDQPPPEIQKEISWFEEKQMILKNFFNDGKVINER